MAELPLISILTPVKNGARYLQECLDSVAQARAGGIAIEHIAIDAASTDGTLEILAAAPDTKVFIEPELNAIRAMEFGVERAAGQYVLFVMADDLLAPGFADIVRALFTRHSDFGAALFSCRLFSDAHWERIVPPPRRIWTALNKYPGENSTIFSRDLLRSVGMSKSYKLTNDRFMMLGVLARASKILYGDAVIAAMRIHEGSATSGGGRNDDVIKHELARMSLELLGRNARGPAASIFTAYAWRRAWLNQFRGALPPASTLALAPLGAMRLSRREDEFSSIGAPSDDAARIVELTRPFVFDTGAP